MIKAVLTDIEGTTSDIAFVRNVLFPYAYERLQAFVIANIDNEAVKQVLADTMELMQKPDASVEECIAQLKQWIEQDKKITPLKTLQGLMWQRGYENGDFTGHLYKDAYEHLKRWHEDGVEIYVFSSGSVKAQKLLFQYSDFGDIRSLFRGHFDTTTGAKTEADSYRNIARAIDREPDEILFLSDMVAELDAAEAAGMKTRCLIRGEEPENNHHKVAYNFAEIRGL